MATESEIQAANEAGLIVDWSPCRAACPACSKRTVEVRQAWRLQTRGFSLAGVQAKFPAVPGWVYRCTSCGVSGAATPK
jgi:hypothetical protein